MSRLTFTGFKKLLSLLVVTMSFALLVVLGSWQVQRLDWKANLIATVNDRVSRAPVVAPGPDTWSGLSKSTDVYRPVNLVGRYIHEAEIHVYFPLMSPAGGPLGGQGYFIMTPFVSVDGWSVFVNRGFVPNQLKERATRLQTLVGGEITISGLMRFSEPKNFATPDADTQKNIWYRRGTEELNAFANLENAAPYWIDLKAGQGVAGLPQGGETRIVFTNSHLQYAFTWFSLALVLFGVVIVYLLRLRKQS